MTNAHWPPLRDGIELDSLEPGCHGDEPEASGHARQASWIAVLIETSIGVVRLRCTGQHETPTDALECARRHISSLKAKRDR